MPPLGGAKRAPVLDPRRLHLAGRTLCAVRIGRRRMVGILTLVALLAILVGVSGFELPIGRAREGSEQPLPGVRAVGSEVLLRVGSGAPPGGELAFLAVEPGGGLFVSDARRQSLLRFDATGHLLSEW